MLRQQRPRRGRVMKARRSLMDWILHSLRGRLVLLMLLAVLPPLLIQVYATYRAKQQAIAHGEAHVLNQARVLALQHEEQVAEVRRRLLALADTSGLTTTLGCRAAIETAQRNAPPYIANFLVIEVDGRRVCTARGDSGPVDLSDRPYFQRALGAIGFLGGDYIISRATGNRVVMFTHTVRRDGEVSMVLGASLDLTWLQRHPQFFELPPGAAYTLYDYNGIPVLRHPEQKQVDTIAEPPASSFWKALLALNGPGVFRGRDGDGSEQLFGSAMLGPAAVPYGRLVVSVPVSAAYADAERAFAIGVLGLAVAFSLSLLIGWFGSGVLVLRPLRPLFATVRRVASGDLEARTGVGVHRNNEIDLLAHELDHMAAALATESRQRLQSEQEVRQGLARAQAYLDVVDVMVVALDTEGTITLVNHKACKVLACPTEGCCLHGNWFDVFVPPEIREELKAVFRRVMSGEREFVDYFENEVLTASGERRLVAWRNTPLRDTDGRTAGTLSAGEDITERKRTEEHLRMTRKMLQLVTDTVPHHVFWKDRQSNYLGCNAAFARSAGLAASEEIVGKTDYDLVWHEQAEQYRRDDATVMATGIARLNCVEPQSLADGRRIWLETSKLPLRDAAGGVIGVLGLYQDITQRKELAEERERLQRSLQQAQKMEALGQLTGGIAHDFNNILTSMLGFSGLALRRYVPDQNSTLAEYLREVITAGERARNLVAKMLTFGRVRPASVAQPVALEPVVRETLQMLASIIPASIEVESRYEENLPDVVIAPTDLQQILINLVINARDAVSGKGKITIGLARARFAEKVCATCGQEIAGDYVTLSVADNGHGIPPDVLPRIFEPFFTTKEVGKGTGMGLSVVYGLVLHTGRHVLVDSRLGAGTVFQVLLPPAPDTAAELSALSTERSAAPARLASATRVMVVDDEAAIRHFFKDVVAANGGAATDFADPLQALACFRQAPALWHAVITDQTMPGMSGVELMLALHALRPELPVILCTGYSEELDETKAVQLGAHRFFNKPVSPDDLIAVLNALPSGPGDPGRRTS